MGTKISHRIPIFASLILLSLGIVFFFFTGRDDSYITYWPAYTLSHFGEILNYNGNRLEQSSSLLLVLLLAVIAWITKIKIAFIGIFLSVLFAVLSIFSMRSLASRLDRQVMPYSLFLTATSVYFVYWSFSGMESTLAAFSIIVFIIAYYDYANKGTARPSIVVFAAPVPYLMVRPEGMFVLLFFLSALLAVTVFKSRKQVHYNEQARKLSFLILTVVSISAILLLSRYYYFGSLFPQPVSAKTSLGYYSIGKGIDYIRSSFSSPDTLLFGILVLSSIVLAIRDFIVKDGYDKHVYIRFSLSVFILVFLSFLVTSGGDWMEGGRLVVPVLPIAAMMVTDLMGRIYYLWKKPFFYAGIIFVVALQLWGVVSFANTESTGRPLWTVGLSGSYFKESDFSVLEKVNLVHLRDIPLTLQMDKVITMLKGKYDKKINIMSAQMGMVPYYISMKHYGKIMLMDRMSLADDLFMKCSLTSDIRRRRTGVDLRYSYFFQEMKYLKAECDMPIPDIIFDIGREHTKHVKKNGYTIAYRQVGSVKAHSGRAFKGKINDNQFIAVRDELMPLLDNRTYRWDWREMKLIENTF